MDRKESCEAVLKTAKEDNEKYNVYLPNPIPLSPKGVEITEKGIKHKYSDLFIPFLLIEGIEANNIPVGLDEDDQNNPEDIQLMFKISKKDFKNKKVEKVRGKY